MKSLAYSSTKEYHREYLRRWREGNPHYSRNWNRLNRNVRITDPNLPNQTGGGKMRGSELFYLKNKEGHCDNCTILLTSIYAEGHNGKTCGECLHRLSTGKH